MDGSSGINKQPVYEQPNAPAQPTYSKQPAGEQDWQYGLFDCFSGADNLCMNLSPSEESEL